LTGHWLNAQDEIFGVPGNYARLAHRRCDTSNGHACTQCPWQRTKCVNGVPLVRCRPTDPAEKFLRCIAPCTTPPPVPKKRDEGGQTCKRTETMEMASERAAPSPARAHCQQAATPPKPVLEEGSQHSHRSEHRALVTRMPSVTSGPPSVLARDTGERRAASCLRGAQRGHDRAAKIQQLQTLVGPVHQAGIHLRIRQW
jgi:hypothetical protein